VDVLNGLEVSAKRNTAASRKELIDYARLIATSSQYNAVLKLEQILKNAMGKFEDERKQKEHFFNIVYLCYKGSDILGGGFTLKNEFENYIEQNFAIDENKLTCTVKNPQLQDLSLEELLLVFGYAKKITFCNKRKIESGKSSEMSGPYSIQGSHSKMQSNVVHSSDGKSKGGNIKEELPEWKKKLGELLGK
jgi:hypothetical protein